MQARAIDQLVNDILADISREIRGAAPHAKASPAPDFDAAFGEILQENDKTDNEIMRRIWKELQETRRAPDRN